MVMRSNGPGGFVPVSRPDITARELEFVTEAIESSWISSTGRFLDEFESRFATSCAVDHAAAVSSGTAGLHLAVAALGAGPGDEVIVPSFTYIASVNAISYVGATPVFVDVDPSTWCLDPDAVAAAVGPRTVGVVAVHLYGHPADMDSVMAIARRHGLWVVEDAAEATFGAYRGRPTGSLGDVGVFSFFGNKVITSGEGGAVTTNDDALAARLRLLRGQGMDPERRYFFPEIGFNFRLTNVAAAILCAQLDRREELLSARHRIADLYRAGLHGARGVGEQPVADWATWTPWLYSVVIDADEYGCDRDAVMSMLGEVGIDTRPFFLPVHTLPPYVELAERQRVDLPHTMRIASAGFNLPLFPTMTNGDVDRVVAVLRDGGHGRG